MSERKVLNKYYPPDFDPSKIPRLHLPKDRQYTVRLMAPCNMRCKTCGEYIYKGKKFNARKETVQGEEYLGIKIFRFYIKCTRCLAEITFKTDPQNADYNVEHGATRNFQALKLAEEQAEREQKELEEEEASNPMKLLENRTKASKNEMEILESLEELKDLNQRQANVDFDQLLDLNKDIAARMKKQQEDEDEALVQSVFGKSDENDGSNIKRLPDNSSDEEETEIIGKKRKFLEANSNILFAKPKNLEQKPKQARTDDSVGFLTTSKSKISAMIKVKGPNKQNAVLRSSGTTTIGNKSQALTLLGNYSDSDSDKMTKTICELHNLIQEQKQAINLNQSILICLCHVSKWRHGKMASTYQSLSEKTLVRLSVPKVALITLAFPFGAFITCILWSIKYDFEAATFTHCRVSNYLPSISAAISFTPQRYIWRICIALHAAPRVLAALCYYKHYRQRFGYFDKSWIVIIRITFLLNLIEILALIGLTYVSSTENYDVHEKCFIAFMACSEIYMLLSCYLFKKCMNSASTLERRSLRWKRILALTNILAFIVALYYFWRHNNYCEAGLYTKFAFFEYIVVLSNMGFHLTACWDFYTQEVTIDSNSDKLS
uniref:Splicing factor YJU2 n=1 Tax=Strigamia maritima TaxID=126957 RepID=T1JLR0_STRMM